MKNSLNYFLDFSEFSSFHLLAQTNHTTIVTSHKNCSPSQKYIFKIFKFNCNSTKNQKIILDTFYQICKKKNPYLRCYNQFSFLYESENTPTFSMKYISSKTLEDILKTPDLLKMWNFENSLKCLFAISEAMCYLHEHLIYHGNLCPSNIIIDEADQSYLCDFGLFPIKKLYIEEKFLFNEIYKDPNMRNNTPTFKNDVYSFGILMCELLYAYFQSKNEIKNETLQSFINKSEKNKFESFPRFFAKLIPSCLTSTLKDRPTFRQIIEIFKNAKYSVLHINIQKLYNDFIKSDYLINLSLKGDTFALNKIGKMYDEGEVIEQDIEKAKDYYKKAALLSNSEAQSNFGVLLQESIGKEDTDMIEGAHYLRLSADQGNIHGMANYGVALLYGHGVEKNLDKAKEYLKKAADLGYSYAQVNYGFALLDNDPNDDEIIEGLGYIKKAMDQNNVDAYYTYGVLLQQGKVVEKNYTLAMEYFKISADQGFSKSMYEYAKGCMNGEGVPKNYEIALHYYKMAGENGYEINKKTLDELIKRTEDDGKNKKSPKVRKTRTKKTTKEPKEKHDKKLSLSEITQSNNEKLETEISEDEFSLPLNQPDQIQNDLIKESTLIKKTNYNSNSNLNELNNQINENQAINNQKQKKSNESNFQQQTADSAVESNVLKQSYFTNFRPVQQQNDENNNNKHSYFTQLRHNQQQTPNEQIKSANKSPTANIQQPINISEKQLRNLIKTITIQPELKEQIKSQTKSATANIQQATNASNNQPKNSIQINSIQQKQKEQIQSQNKQPIVNTQQTINTPKTKLRNSTKTSTIQAEPKEQIQYPNKSPNSNKKQPNTTDKQPINTIQQNSILLNKIQQPNKISQINNNNQQPNILSKNNSFNQQQNSYQASNNNQQPKFLFQNNNDQKFTQIENVHISSEIAPIYESDSSEEEDEEEEKFESSQDKYIDQIRELNLPTEELIKIGGSFEKDDPSKSFLYYEEAAKRGNKSAYLKCAEICSIFETKVKYFKLAVENDIPGSFIKLRSYLSKQIALRKDKETYRAIGEIFESVNDYADAALFYKKSKDKQNFAICFEKAKKKISNIKDGNQQFTFGNLLKKQKEFPLSLIMFKKSFENGISAAREKIAELEQILQSMSQNQQSELKPKENRIESTAASPASSVSVDSSSSSKQKDKLTEKSQVKIMESNNPQKTTKNTNSEISTSIKPQSSMPAKTNLQNENFESSPVNPKPTSSEKKITTISSTTVNQSKIPSAKTAIQTSSPFTANQQQNPSSAQKTKSTTTINPPQITSVKTALPTSSPSNQPQMPSSAQKKASTSTSKNPSQMTSAKTAMPTSSPSPANQPQMPSSTQKTASSPHSSSTINQQQMASVKTATSASSPSPINLPPSSAQPTPLRNLSLSTQNPASPTPKISPPDLSSDTESLLQKGLNYYEGKNGFSKDLVKAMLYFKKASKKGCPRADFYIGDNIKDEIGAKYMKSAADSGDPKGQLKYANYLKKGIGVIKDVKMAMKYYELAADQGLAEAQFEYGREKFEKGLTEQEKSDGIFNIVKSVRQDYPDALFYYSKILKDIEPERSNEFYQKSLELKSQLALKELDDKND